MWLLIGDDALALALAEADDVGPGVCERGGAAGVCDLGGEMGCEECASAMEAGVAGREDMEAERAWSMLKRASGVGLAEALALEDG